MPVQKIHLDREQGLADLGAAAVDDDEDIVVGVVPGVTARAGTE